MFLTIILIFFMKSVHYIILYIKYYTIDIFYGIFLLKIMLDIPKFKLKITLFKQ